MKCIVCKTGTTQAGTATISIDKGTTIVVIRNVPAEICSLCGEEYLDTNTMKEIEALVVSAQKAGINIAVQQFKAA
jgi:YgiT-type zinc finger domain-containing protein